MRAAVFRRAAGIVFALQFVLLDALVRGPRAWVEQPRILVSLAESALLWTVALVLATTRPRRLIVAVLAAALLVVQALVFRYYRAPLDVQVAESALHAWRDVSPVLSRAAPAIALSIVMVAALEHALLAFAERPRLARHGVHALALAGLFGMAPRHATPEVRGLHALFAVRRDPPKAIASAVTLPVLHSERRDPPNVLLVITESVRTTEYDATTAPETTAAFPDRAALREMRAVSSYTALSLSALLTGRTQEAPRDAILRAPSVFDYAHAARYSVGYWSAHAADIFEAKSVHAATDRFVTVESLVGKDPDDDWVSPLDRMIVDRFTAEIGEVAGARPLFAVLHLVGTHAPYHVDPARAPFQPYDHVVTWAGMPKLLNAYKNAILEQDREIARALRAFVDRSEAGGRSWLIAFTSDHGEAFGEHGAIHHGQNLYDEQVRVPAWIASSGGALSTEQRAALADHERRAVTHLDVLPTLLDGMGLWDNFAIGAHQHALRGRSVLRPYVSRGMIPVTNCTAMFRCPLNTWGLYEDDHKLVAHLWDGNWECLVGPAGTAERVADPGDPRGDRLREESRRHFPLLPNGTPNR